jgi:hypothetical protein
MQALLSQLNSVPGVAGTMVCDAEGRLLGHAFPPLFDASMLRDAAAALTDCLAGLQDVTGDPTMVDLRYGDARIVVKPMAGARLLMLCTPQLNSQVLSLSTSVAVPKLEKLVAAGATAQPMDGPAASPRAQPSQLHCAVQRIEQIIVRRNLPAFKTRGEIAIKAGFALGLVDASTPDDPERLARLTQAALEVLHESI